MAKEEAMTEYVNKTKSTHVWIDRTTPYAEEPKPYCVLPGKSVHLTTSDFKRNYEQSGVLFDKGLLRKVTAGGDKLVTINVKDDMSEEEMELFVKRAEDIKNFGSSLRKLVSINTLNNILDLVKTSNKTYNFIETVERRMDKINKEADEQE